MAKQVNFQLEPDIEPFFDAIVKHSDKTTKALLNGMLREYWYHHGEEIARKRLEELDKIADERQMLRDFLDQLTLDKT